MKGRGCNRRIDESNNTKQNCYINQRLKRMVVTSVWVFISFVTLLEVNALPPGLSLDDIPADMLPEGFSIDDIPPDFNFDDIPAGMLPEGFSPDMIPPDVIDKRPTEPSQAVPQPAEPTQPPSVQQPTVIDGLISPKLFFNVSGYIGGTVVLRCNKTIGSNGPMIWLHPKDGSPISREREVVLSMQRRLEIIGNPKKGEYDLVVKYLRFPEDEGNWSCVSFNGITQSSSLTVLVPPPSKMPHVTPENISVLDAYSDAWSFTCTAHFAHPPVTLKWERISGRDMEYDVTPMSYITSPDNTMAVSSKLIVTGRNFGSVFSCSASHPSYNGKVYTQKALFLPPKALEAVGYLKAKAASMMPVLSLGSSDYAMVAVIIVVAFIVFITGACLFTTRRKWELDVRLRGDFMSLTATDYNRNGSAKSGCSNCDSTSFKGVNQLRKAERRKCVSKVVFGVILSGFLLFSLLFAVPLYMKGVSIPMLSYAYNSTVGFDVGSRVSSNKLGQISIWPMFGGEEGVYSCEVAGIMDDTGRTKLKVKTFGVFVVTGMIINYPLLGVLGLGVLCTLGIITMGICHSCKCVKHRQSVCLNRLYTPNYEGKASNTSLQAVNEHAAAEEESSSLTGNHDSTKEDKYTGNDKDTDSPHDVIEELEEEDDTKDGFDFSRKTDDDESDEQNDDHKIYVQMDMDEEQLSENNYLMPTDVIRPDKEEVEDTDVITPDKEEDEVTENDTLLCTRL